MKDTGGSAFPIGDSTDIYDNGMTLRDYFAGQALIGLVNDRHHDFPEKIERAYKFADAMIKEKTNEQR